MQITTKYEPTTPGSQFVKPVHYLLVNGKEYNLADVVEKLYQDKVLEPIIYNKLKRASVQTIALTVKDHLHKL